MNKQQLASKIWAGANALRGKVSADAYKDYMLGFVFYKYLSNYSLLKKLVHNKNNLIRFYLLFLLFFLLYYLY